MHIFVVKAMEMERLSFGSKLKELRLSRNITLEELSVMTSIDKSLLSRYESGKRTCSKEHLYSVAKAFQVEYEGLHKAMLVEQVYDMISSYHYAMDVLTLAEERVAFLNSSQSTNEIHLPEDIRTGLSELDTLKELWAHSSNIDPLQEEKMKEYFKVKYSYESNKIEGNTLSLKETHLVINEGVTIGGKSIQEHLEAINHADAIDFLEDLVRGNVLLNQRTLLQLHQLILKGVNTRQAGVYRTVPVYISGSEHKPPEPYLIDKMMEDYFLFYETNKDVLHPVILAAEMKERLVTIHPFIDGNGRVSRLIMNFILLSHGYTTVILKGDIDSKSTYFSCLEKVQTEGDPLPFYRLIIERACDSIREHLQLSA